MDNLPAWISAFAALLGAIAAGLAAFAARAANTAAGIMSRIETARRHQELTPRMSVLLEPLNEGDLRVRNLTLTLLGPAALRQLSGVAIRVRNDRPGRDIAPPGFGDDQATREQLRTQIWGPLRLTRGVTWGHGRVDDTGRCIDIPDTVSIGDPVVLQMEQAPPPPWWTGTDAASMETEWRQTVGTTVRLEIELRPASTGLPAGDEPPWVLTVELEPDGQGIAYATTAPA